jgi:hypothetical protein
MIYSDYKPGDTVIAIEEFKEPGEPYIPIGTVDVIESVSSNHHGGLQLNLVKHGRGWGRVWRKVEINAIRH